jgi:hypothetical protein
MEKLNKDALEREADFIIARAYQPKRVLDFIFDISFNCLLVICQIRGKL